MADVKAQEARTPVKALIHQAENGWHSTFPGSPLRGYKRPVRQVRPMTAIESRSVPGEEENNTGHKFLKTRGKRGLSARGSCLSIWVSFPVHCPPQLLLEQQHSVQKEGGKFQEKGQTCKHPDK